MAKNMSFSMTTDQFRAKMKTVTRRYGWWDAKVGDIYNGVEKAMGLKKGEKIKVIHKIRIISVRKERFDRMILNPDYGKREMFLEGFPFGITDPAEFVLKLSKAAKKQPQDDINRIEFQFIKE